MFRFVIVHQIVNGTHQFITDDGCLVAFFFPEAGSNKYVGVICYVFKIQGVAVFNKFLLKGIHGVNVYLKSFKMR